MDIIAETIKENTKNCNNTLDVFIYLNALRILSTILEYKCDLIDIIYINEEQELTFMIEELNVLIYYILQHKNIINPINDRYKIMKEIIDEKKYMYIFDSNNSKRTNCYPIKYIKQIYRLYLILIYLNY